MHDGLQEITLVINELKSRLYEIIGVNDAMMGAVSNEASGSQLRQRITQGAATNGILYDNFNASLEYHIKHKEIPLIAHEMYVRRPKAIRKLGAGRGEWRSEERRVGKECRSRGARAKGGEKDIGSRAA